MKPFCVHPRLNFVRSLAPVCVSVLLVVLTGCGFFTVAAPVTVAGHVLAGQQPIVGASVQLYAVGQTGDGSASTPLLKTPVSTDSSGSFKLTSVALCTPGVQVYLAAAGGKPGIPSGANNAQIKLLTILGDCSLLTTATSVVINSVTTVDAAAAMASFASSSTAIGSASSDASSLAAAASVFEQLVDPASGSTPGPALLAGFYGSNLESNTLANALEACVESPGGVAGDGSPCGQLFRLLTPADGPAPTDTFAAALCVALDPAAHLADLYQFCQSGSAFQPSLAGAPASWLLLPVPYAPVPTLSPASGTYTVGQTVRVAATSSMPTANLFYTTDGSTPTTSSSIYSGPIPVSAPATIRVLTSQSGYKSTGSASATYSFNPASAATPLFSPAPGSYSSAQTVSITSPDAGASIFYTTDGSNPTVASTRYTAPITVAANTTIRAVAAGPGAATSAIASAAYVIYWPGYMAFGDSITACCAPSVPANLYANRLGDVLRLKPTNLGIAGAVSCDVGRLEVFGVANPSDTNNNLQTLLVSTNDVNISGAGAYEATFNLCEQAVIAWLGSSSSNRTTGASFATPPPGWSFDTTYNLSNPLIGLSSTTYGATSTWPLVTTGGPIAIWYRIVNSNGGSFSYAVDSGTPVPVKTQPAPAIASNVLESLGLNDSVGVVFASAPAGSHAVTITVTSPASSSNLVGILAVGTSPEASRPQGPRVFVGGTPIQNNVVNTNATAAYNADIQADVNRLASMGFGATFVDIRHYLHGTAAEMSDQFHPNDIGHLELEEAFQAAISDTDATNIGLAVKPPLIIKVP